MSNRAMGERASIVVRTMTCHDEDVATGKGSTDKFGVAVGAGQVFILSRNRCLNASRRDRKRTAAMLCISRKPHAHPEPPYA